MNHLLSVLTIYLFSGLIFCSGQSNVIADRLRSVLISQSLNDDEISQYLESLKPDGSWTDINYLDRSNTNWEPQLHSSRLLRICRAYNKPESRFFHRKAVLDAITSIIGYYIAAKPQSANWWYNAIGAPVNFGPSLVLMKSANGFGIDENLLRKYSGELLLYYNESVEIWPHSATGANKIWLLNSSIHKACVMNNDEVLRQNFKSAFEEAAIMPGNKEGIKKDNSFWQHGPQLYCAGYGLSFLNDITSFGALAHGTDYSMTGEQLATLVNAVLDGYRWFCQHGSFDHSTAGREISRRGAVSSAGMKACIERLLEMDAPRSEELKRYISFIDGETSFENPGNRHFWRSDIMVQHGTDFYISARVPSVRVIGTERMNNENLKRKWLPWGAMTLMSEGDEYRNLFPVWDWSRIPGVTSYLEDVPVFPVTGGAYLVSLSEFAGGVSDGKYGLAAYNYSWDSIAGKKAWFFTPDAVVCLGSGIVAAREAEVVTTVNQCFSSGIVKIKNGKKITEFSGTEINMQEPAWIYHDNFGYLFPSGGNVTLRNIDQTGSWSEINTSQSNEKLKHRVFSLWINHGNHPVDARYEYIIVPSSNVRNLEKWVEKNPIHIISNTSAVQCVQNRVASLFATAFYLPGTISLDKGLTLSADNPCLILTDLSDKRRMRICVSDPTQTLSTLRLKVSCRLQGENVSTTPDGSLLKIQLPTGEEAGKSVIFEYSIID